MAMTGSWNISVLSSVSQADRDRGSPVVTGWNRWLRYGGTKKQGLRQGPKFRDPYKCCG
jgi:hypothetical protein